AKIDHSINPGRRFSATRRRRSTEGTTLLRGGKLFQQYLVDAFTAVEEQRLKWTQNNQDTLRVDLYHNLFVYVIAFQKQELPHVHIFLWLEECFKCTTPDEINDIISVELPFPAEDLDGYKVVSEFMLQGPCRKDATYAPCTIDGKCSKHYPSMRVNEYSGKGEIDLQKQNFNRWVLAVGDGKLPAKKKETKDKPTWIEIPEEFLIKS
nr:DNA helicase PIF1, ATP-dependent [Tanacetum cinerariifolium]